MGTTLVCLAFSNKTYIFDDTSLKHYEIKINHKENKFDESGDIIHEHNSYKYLQLVLNSNYLNNTGNRNLFFDLNLDFSKEDVHIVIVEKFGNNKKRKRTIEKAKINGYREQFFSGGKANEIIIDFKAPISTSFKGYKKSRYE